MGGRDHGQLGLQAVGGAERAQVPAHGQVGAHHGRHYGNTSSPPRQCRSRFWDVSRWGRGDHREPNAGGRVLQWIGGGPKVAGSIPLVTAVYLRAYLPSNGDLKVNLRCV